MVALGYRTMRDPASLALVWGMARTEPGLHGTSGSWLAQNLACTVPLAQVASLASGRRRPLPLLLRPS